MHKNSYGTRLVVMILILVRRGRRTFIITNAHVSNKIAINMPKVLSLPVSVLVPTLTHINYIFHYF